MSKRIRNIVSLLLVGLLIGSVAAVSQTGSLDKILREGKFNVGVVLMTPATNKDPNTGEYSGYLFDAIQWICDQMGVELVIHEAEWSTIIAGLQAGKYDLSAASTFATVQRALAVAFTDPLLYKGLGAVSLTGSGIDALEDIDQPGVKVATVLGTAEHQWAVVNIKNAELIVPSATAEITLEGVKTGAYDVVITDMQTVGMFIDRNPEVQWAAQQIVSMPISWLVRYDDHDLLTFMNSALRMLIGRGIFEGILKSYYFAPGMSVPSYSTKPAVPSPEEN